jgi:phage baseplate assembly protein W
MTALADVRQRLRDRAEHHLRVAAMEELRLRRPAGTTPAYREPGALLWRRVFVPLYRRVPWEVKTRAMHALGMTAERSGWTPPARRPREPWRPPAP